MSPATRSGRFRSRTAVLGLYLGRTVAVAVLVGVLAAAIVGSVVMARVGVAVGPQDGTAARAVPGPGAVVALLAGGSLVHWYLHSII